jgi:DNA replication protein DnaC
MKENILQRALYQIQSNKRANEKAFEEKMTKLNKDAEFVETQKKYTKIVIENAKKEAYGIAADKAAEQKLFDRLEAIKTKHNLQNLHIEYSCPICKDEGYVNGKACECLKRETSKILLKESGFEKLENFDDSVVTCDQLAPVYEKMKKWCNSNSQKNLIFIAGPIGVGKTHLTRCMANEFIKNGKLTIFTTALNLSFDFKTFNKNLDEEVLRKYLSADVLFIDDLGTEPLFKNITVEYLYLIINERKVKNKKTIISSNLSLDDIRERYEERIFSRIADRKTSINIFINGQDRRIKK